MFVISTNISTNRTIEYPNQPVLQSQPDFIYLLTSYHRCHRRCHFIVDKTNSVSQCKKTNPVHVIYLGNKWENPLCSGSRSVNNPRRQAGLFHFLYVTCIVSIPLWRVVFLYLVIHNSLRVSTFEYYLLYIWHHSCCPKQYRYNSCCPKTI